MTTRVLHVITGLGTGGAETSLLQLLSGLGADRAGHHVLSLLDRGTMANSIEALGVPVTTLGAERGRFDVRRLTTLLRTVRALSPGVIHGWMYHGNLAATIAALACRKRPGTIWGVRHALDAWEQESPRFRQIVHLSARCSTSPRFIVYNSARAAVQHASRGFATRGSRVIPNGFDLHRFAPSDVARQRIRGELRLDADTPLVGLLARVDPLKDHANFVAAAALLSARNSDVRFVLAGRGTDDATSALHRQLSEAGLVDRVHTLGERSDAPALLAALDVATLTSISEGFPNAIGEAMATGIPCVVTDVGDAAALVGPTGIVVPPSRPDALAGAWHQTLAMTPSSRAALGRAARDRIAREYELSVVASRYRDMYALMEAPATPSITRTISTPRAA